MRRMTSRRLSTVRERRDSLGRRIGYNWWREFICSTLADADDAWCARRESGEITSAAPGSAGGVSMYQLSDAEYAAAFPRPTLKEFLIANAGMREASQVA